MQVNVNSQLQPELQKEQIVTALLDCSTIKNNDTRKAIADTLAEKFGCQIEYFANTRLHVEKIVAYCLDQPDGMVVLLQRIREYDGNDSIAARKVEELCHQSSDINPSNGSRTKNILTSPTGQYSSTDYVNYLEAKKLHYDTTEVVEMFVNMVKAKDNPEFCKILGIQGDKKIGFTSLTNRLQQICEDKLSVSFPILCVKSHITETIPYAIAGNTLDAFKDEITKQYQKKPAQWQEAYSQAKDLKRKLDQLIKPDAELTQTDINKLTDVQLSGFFTECLTNFILDKNFLVIIFLHNFDNASSATRDWLKYWFSHEAWGFFGKLIVVVTGTDKLEFLRSFQQDDRKPCILMKPTLVNILGILEDWLKICGYELPRKQIEAIKEIFKISYGEIEPDNFQNFINFIEKLRQRKVDFEALKDFS